MISLIKIKVKIIVNLDVRILPRNNFLFLVQNNVFCGMRNVRKTVTGAVAHEVGASRRVRMCTSELRRDGQQFAGQSSIWTKVGPENINKEVIVF